MRKGSIVIGDRLNQIELFIMYTLMNFIEKKQNTRKEQFFNESSLERFVCDHMIQCNLRFSTRVYLGFNLVQPELTRC